jgi:hypothetical protein
VAVHVARAGACGTLLTVHTAHRAGRRWGQIEREIEPHDLQCHDDFTYGIMLRQPVELMASVAAYNGFDVRALVPWLLSTPPSALCGAACAHRGHPGFSWQAFDNLMVRAHASHALRMCARLARASNVRLTRYTYANVRFARTRTPPWCRLW